MSLRLVLGREALGGEGGPRLGWVEQLSRLLLLLLLLYCRRESLNKFVGPRSLSSTPHGWLIKYRATLYYIIYCPHICEESPSPVSM